MSNFIGNLSNFDHKSQDWNIFFGKLSNFIKLNEIKTDKCCAVLLAHLSDESYRLVRNLAHPQDLNNVSWNELVKLLNNHFGSKRSTFVDRAKFYDAVKTEDESIEDWAARLRGLAIYCDFGAELDSVLRDRFVLGLKMGPERDRLFEQDLKSLTLAKAIEVAQQAACARAARSYADAGEHPVVKQESVYRVSERRAQASGSGVSGSARAPRAAGARCAVCGLTNHHADKCRFRNYKCLVCGDKGHLKKMCVKKFGKVALNNIDTSEVEQHICKECSTI